MKNRQTLAIGGIEGLNPFLYEGSRTSGDKARRHYLIEVERAK